MKIISFFSEKGGMGKTTLSVMFASWMKYKKGEKVYVFDFDFPGYQMFQMRKRELEKLEEDDSPLKVLTEGNSFYPIGTVQGNYKGYTEQELRTICEKIRAVKQSGEGYAVLDFPGRFLRNDPVYRLVKEGLIDLVVFPIDTDIQSISSALNICNMFKDARIFPEGTADKALFMWNRETANERKGRKDWYEIYTHLFSSLGIPEATIRMRNIEILRRDPPTFGFVRSTLCWPEANVKSRCPYVDNLFEEIKARLDGNYSELTFRP